ncbi:unnamed protein product [Urochloa decumbens]|uniref:F-box domain-containing protein n=1 Tax=Urochloa decumbens TaxID=240449 RepID=A0ABC9FRJ7_9POAL
MAPGRRRHRRGGDERPKMKTSSRKKEATAGPATSVHDIPDHVLELIFLRMDSCASVVRAASACRRWCHLLAGAAFASRFGSLPLLAGHYHTVHNFFDRSLAASRATPVFVPSPGMAGVDPRHFSLDFLPDSTSWELADSRGGLLLLFKKSTAQASWSWTGYRYLPDQLVVCEPSTRRHQGILSPPYLQGKCIGLFLLHGDGDDGSAGGRRIGMSNFRVLAVLHEFKPWVYGRIGPVACAFSSGCDGGWRVLPESAAAFDGDAAVPDRVEQISFAGRVGGSAYWAIGQEHGASMLVLDVATAAFSVVTFPEHLVRSHDRHNFRVISGEDGGLRVVRLLDNELKVFGRRHGSDEWVLRNHVRLPEATRGLPGHEDRFFQQNAAVIVAAEETHVVVTPQEKTWPFSVDLETMEVERALERNKYAGTAFPYELPWPPAVLMTCAQRGRSSRPRR